MQDPLRLRGLAVSAQPTYSSQVYYTISTSLSAEGILQPTQSLDTWPPRDQCQHDRLWQVRSTVLEVVSAVQVPTPPLPQPIILTNGRARSHMHLRVTASHGTSKDVYLIDLGQTLEVYARYVTVETLATPGGIHVSDGQGGSLNGTVGNALVIGQVEAIEESRSSTLALLTETYYVRATDVPVGTVPAGARELTILPDDPNAPVDFRWWRGAPPNGFQMGVTRLPAAWQPPSSMTPSATHWQIAPEAVDRAISLVWGIQT